MIARVMRGVMTQGNIAHRSRGLLVLQSLPGHCDSNWYATGSCIWHHNSCKINRHKHINFGFHYWYRVSVARDYHFLLRRCVFALNKPVVSNGHIFKLTDVSKPFSSVRCGYSLFTLLQTFRKNYEVREQSSPGRLRWHRSAEGGCKLGSTWSARLWAKCKILEDPTETFGKEGCFVCRGSLHSQFFSIRTVTISHRSKQ